MEAELFLEVLCGLSCVIVSLLIWILFRTEKQMQEFRLRLENFDNDLKEMVEEMDGRKEEEEATKYETNREREMIATRVDKIEELIQDASKLIESLQKNHLGLTGRTDEMEEMLKSSFTESKAFMDALESIRLEIQNDRAKMTTVPLHRYYNKDRVNHYYQTGLEAEKLSKMGYVYEGVAGLVISTPFNP